MGSSHRFLVAYTYSASLVVLIAILKPIINTDTNDEITSKFSASSLLVFSLVNQSFKMYYGSKLEKYWLIYPSAVLVMLYMIYNFVLDIKPKLKAGCLRKNWVKKTLFTVTFVFSLVAVAVNVFFEYDKCVPLMLILPFELFLMSLLLDFRETERDFQIVARVFITGYLDLQATRALVLGLNNSHPTKKKYFYY